LCPSALDDQGRLLGSEKHSLANLKRLDRANPYAFAARYLHKVRSRNPAACSSAPSVCSAWEETRTGYHLLHVWRGRVEYPTLKAKMAELAAEGKPAAILVEDKASGQSLIQEYRQSPPLQAPWLADYEAELFLFPRAKHDDQVDRTSQALRWMRDSSAGFAWASNGRRETLRESFAGFVD